jgi:hypothetical protein
LKGEKMKNIAKKTIMNGVTIDVSLYKKLGITVLTSKQVKERPLIDRKEEWSEDELFEPEGITLEEAHRAMKRCKGKL